MLNDSRLACALAPPRSDIFDRLSEAYMTSNWMSWVFYR
jgi:hypothetical protein